MKAVVENGRAAGLGLVLAREWSAILDDRLAVKRQIMQRVGREKTTDWGEGDERRDVSVELPNQSKKCGEATKFQPVAASLVECGGAAALTEGKSSIVAATRRWSFRDAALRR